MINSVKPSLGSQTIKKKSMKGKLFFSSIFLLLLFQYVDGQSVVKHTDFKLVEVNNAPIARHENGFVAIGDTFYLLGGRGIKKISIYNVGNNTWTLGKEPPLEIHHFQAVTFDRKIYVVAAMTGKYPYETPLSLMLIYDPVVDQWKEGPRIPEDRQRGSAGVIVKNDKLYLISGIVDGHNAQHVPWVDVYDFKTKKWKVLADAPRPRDHFHAAYFEGKIYAAGGRNSSYATKQTFELTVPEIDVYDIAKNSWSTLPNELNIPTQRAGASTVIYRHKLFVIGGESTKQKVAHNEVEVYDIGLKKWDKAPRLNIGRHGTQAVLHGKSIYITAGSGNMGGRPELSSLEKLVLSIE